MVFPLPEVGWKNLVFSARWTEETPLRVEEKCSRVSSVKLINSIVLQVLQLK